MGRRRNVGDDGCLFWLAVPIGAIILSLGGLGWLANNNLLAPTLGIIFIVIILIGILLGIRDNRKQKSEKAREMAYVELVRTNIDKWRAWKKDFMPTINGKVYLEDGEKLLFSAPFKLKVGDSNRIKEGILNLTNMRLIFSSKSSTKKQAYRDIFTVEFENNCLYIQPKKDDKNLCFWSNRESEEQNRITLAEAYVIWFLQNGGMFDAAESTVLQILGVKKT